MQGEKNMYKLVAIDLDGTMLNSYGIVTQNTKEKIKKVIQKGTKVVIASGRPIDSIKAIAEEIGSKEYFIGGNGAIIYDIKKDEIIYEKFLNKQKVLEIIDLCEENSINYNVYTEKTILAKNLKFNVLYYYKENLKKPENKKTNIVIVENMKEYIKNLKEEKFLKVTICDENKFIFNAIGKKLKELSGIEILDVLHMSRKLIKQGTQDIVIEYFYTEISLENVDKWIAIQEILKLEKIEKDEVITIGDNINDLKMLKNAGLGIAMKGSAPKVIENANYVTQGNNEEGVANALEKYILKDI